MTSLVSSYPIARLQDLVTTETGTDTLIYDTQQHQLHTLSALAVSILRLCDGTRSASDIAEHLGLPSADIDGVADALLELARADLFEQSDQWKTPSQPNLSRRKLAKRALAGVVIISVSAPTAAAATTPATVACIPFGIEPPVDGGCSKAPCCPGERGAVYVCTRGICG